MIVDLFAGPGGWDEGLRALGLSALGIEWDASACATAVAAGHPRLQQDVAESQVMEGIVGLIASPPCQGFSAAGKGLGRGDKDQIVRCAHDLAQGRDTRESRGTLCADPRSMLTVEPLRWALEANPEWIALEQVPQVLPLWELFAEILRFRGYFVDTGILHAEQFGVPQTRKRAYLVASKGQMVHLPAPTHQKYKKGEPAQGKDGLAPWVSMAQALGWDEGYVGFPRRADAGRPSIELAGVRYRDRDLRSVSEPAQVVTEKTRSWQVWGMTQSARSNATQRHRDEPAPTITGGHDFAERRWIPERVEYRRGGDRIHESTSVDVPAPTITSRVNRWQVKGEGPDTIRVTEQHAAVLQGFPASYPWQGTRTKQFEQIGNAVCPPVAAAVLGEAIGLALARAA